MTGRDVFKWTTVVRCLPSATSIAFRIFVLPCFAGLNSAILRAVPHRCQLVGRLNPLVWFFRQQSLRFLKYGRACDNDGLAGRARSVIERLGVEERTSRSLLVLRLSEPCRFVDVSCPVIAFLHLQSELATTHLPRSTPNLLKKPPSNSLPTKSRQHRQVVDVDERTGSECREPLEADGDANGIFALVRKEDDRGRMLLQARNKGTSNLIGQRSTVAHRIGGVSVNKFHDCPLVLRSVEISFDDFNRQHFGIQSKVTVPSRFPSADHDDDGEERRMMDHCVLSLVSKCGVPHIFWLKSAEPPRGMEIVCHVSPARIRATRMIWPT